MFESAPAWSASIANLTEWFDWNAIAALVTTWALWFALRQAGKAERIELKRSLAVISSYWTLVEAYAKSLGRLEQILSSRPELAAKAFIESGVTDHILAILDQYTFRDFPTHRIIAEQAAVKVTIRDLAQTLAARTGGLPIAEEVKATRLTLERSIETVKEEAAIAFASGFRRAWLRAKQRAARSNADIRDPVAQPEPDQRSA